MPDRKVAIWTAVSSGEQAKRYSLDTQLAECAEFVAAIPTRYGDTATVVAEISMADTRSVIEYGEAVAMYPHSYGILDTLIKQRKINVLLCVRRDRLGREDSLIMTIDALCRRYGVKVVAIKSSIPATLDHTDDEGTGYVTAIEAVTARVEVKRLQSRRESGMVGRVTDLRLFPGKRPWGYSYRYSPVGEIEATVMDEGVKRVIRKILIDYFLVRGLGLPAIAILLEGSDSPTSRGWSETAVRCIFEKLARYAGWIEYNQKSRTGREYVRVRGDYESMITEAEFQAVKAEMESRQYRKQRRHNPLSGIVYCASCKAVMSYNIRFAGNRQRIDLRCDNPECKARTVITSKKIIDSLTDTFAAFQTVRIDDLLHRVSARPNAIGPAQSQIASIQTEIGKLEEERRRAVHAYITLGALTDRELDTQLKRIDTRIATATSDLDNAEARLREAIQRGMAADRLREVRESGLSILDRIDDDPAMVNQWLRKHSVIALVSKGSRTDERVEIVIG